MSRRTSLATRKQRRRPEEVREHTQTDQLIDRLTKHALSEKPLMDESQVQTALTVLNKLLPDLTVTQLMIDADSPSANSSDGKQLVLHRKPLILL
jgi:hypothetical protein